MPGSLGRHCDAPDSVVPPVKGSFPKKWLRFPAPRPPPSSGLGDLPPTPRQPFLLWRSPGPRLLEEQCRARQVVIEEPVMVETEQPDKGSKPDSATCSHLLLAKYLIFWSFSDLIGKMETIIRTKEGFKNSVRMYGAHAASRLGRIPPSHWRLLPFGVFRSPGGPSPGASPQDPSLWPFTYCLLSLVILAVTAFIPRKCSSSYILDTCCVQAHVACWGCRNHSAAGPVPWALMAE